MTKIICFDVNDEKRPFMEEWAKEHGITVDTYQEALSVDNVHLVEGYDGLTVAAVGEVDPRLYPLLKERNIHQIAQRTAGYENFDLNLATENGLIISNAANYSPESIAEFSLLMALQLIRQTKALDQQVHEHDFRWLPQFRGRTISNKTVAVLGVGAIGYKVAQLYHAFGATVLGYDPFPKEEAKAILTYCDSPEDAVKQADIVTLHMPATEENYHLFDQTMFKLMKPTAHLVNAGRGSLIHTKDLLEALDEGELASAALDVYENESPYIPGDFRDTPIEDPLFEALLNHPKVTFYHHCAYYTDVSIRNMSHIALNATLDVIRTGDTAYRVN